MIDTICAIATGQGGALGIVRLSGPQAFSAVDRIFRPAKGDKVSQRKAYTIAYGQIMDGDEPVDDVLVSIFKAPHSYTGEDSLEISCHNSSYIMQRVMSLLLHSGCRLARPGEYTERAFVNGRMDLSQAEAVADLIASRTAATHRLAMRQMRGQFSRELKALRDKLVHIASMMELELDFSDHEELSFADPSEVEALIDEIERKIRRLSDSFRLGNALKQGIPVAIIGETNVGKSTLLNALLGDDKAIVSDVAGTTRDVIEDVVSLGGYLFRFIDTAGLRTTDDPVERLGIERTRQQMQQAALLLWMIDATSAYSSDLDVPQGLSDVSDDKSVILVFNKADLLSSSQLEQIRSTFQNSPHHHIFISAKQGTHLQELKSMLIEEARLPATDEDEYIVTNLRHYEALQRSLDCIANIREGLSSHLPTDLLSEDLRQCIYHLSDIVGEVTSEDILHSIFSHFCIGK